MNKRKLGSFALCVMLFALCSSAAAQQPKKVFRSGYVAPTAAPTDHPSAAQLGLAMRELAYIEGQSVASEYRYAQGQGHRASALGTELLRRSVDILVAGGGSLPVRPVMHATT